MISGIRWVSECGDRRGEDIFAISRIRNRRAAASWPMRAGSWKSGPRLSSGRGAARSSGPSLWPRAPDGRTFRQSSNQLFEIKSADILQPGPRRSPMACAASMRFFAISGTFDRGTVRTVRAMENQQRQASKGSAASATAQRQMEKNDEQYSET